MPIISRMSAISVSSNTVALCPVEKMSLSTGLPPGNHARFASLINSKLIHLFDLSSVVTLKSFILLSLFYNHFVTTNICCSLRFMPHLSID